MRRKRTGNGASCVRRLEELLELLVDADLREVNLLLLAHLHHAINKRGTRGREEGGRRADQTDSDEDLLRLLGEVHNDHDDVDQVNLSHLAS